jgi:hypothetical protein
MQVWSAFLQVTHHRLPPFTQMLLLRTRTDGASKLLLQVPCLTYEYRRPRRADPRGPHFAARERER